MEAVLEAPFETTQAKTRTSHQRSHNSRRPKAIVQRYDFRRQRRGWQSTVAFSTTTTTTFALLLLSLPSFCQSLTVPRIRRCLGSPTVAASSSSSKPVCRRSFAFLQKARPEVEDGIEYLNLGAASSEHLINVPLEIDNIEEKLEEPKEEEMLEDGNAQNEDAEEEEEEEEEDDDDDVVTYRTNLKIAALAEQCAQRVHQSGPRGTRRNAVQAALEAVDLLRGMSHPDTVAFNTVLKCLAKVSPARMTVHASGRPAGDDVMSTSFASDDTSSNDATTAASMAVDLLQEMKALQRQQVEANRAWYEALAAVVDPIEKEDMLQAGPPYVRVKPNVRSYATVMDAVGRQGTAAGAAAAHALLDEMAEACDADGSLKPNLVAYNTLLSAYAKCGGTAAAEKCVELWYEMPVAPDIISCNAVLHALSRSGRDDAGECAEEWLRSMMAAGTGATTARRGAQDAADAMRNIDSNTAGQQEEEEENSEQQNNAPVAAAASAPRRLRWLQHRHVPPNARSFTTCLSAWSRAGRPERAHALLREMEASCDRGDDADDSDDSNNSGHHDTSSRWPPNIVSYSSVIHAYAVSRHPDRVKRAYDVYRTMTKRGIAPNRVTLNNLLHASCSGGASTRDSSSSSISNNKHNDKDVAPRKNKDTSLDTVRTLYEAILARNEADHVTFGTVLKAVGQHRLAGGSDDHNLSNNHNSDHDDAHPPADAFAASVFDEACRRGHVSKGVLKQFRSAVSPKTYARVLQEHGLVYSDVLVDAEYEPVGLALSWKQLPSAWRRHVAMERDARPLKNCRNKGRRKGS